MADNFVDWPIIVNDDGSLSLGTPFSAEYNNAARASVADQVYTAANPTVLPRMITDQVVTAQGTFTSLEQRLAGVISPSGVFIAPPGQVTQAQIQSLLGTYNLAGNDVFLIWAAGDAAAPGFWILGGAGAAVARAGVLTSGSESSPPADTDRKIGDFCAKVTSAGGAAATLTQTLLSTAAMTRAGDGFKGQSVGFGAWVKSSFANSVRLAVADGIGTTFSAFHTGGGAWEWISGTRVLNAAATTLTMFLDVAAGTVVAYISGAFVGLSQLAPTGWRPGGWFRFQFRMFSAGVQTAAANKQEGFYVPTEGAILQAVLIRLGTVNVGANFVVDVNSVGVGSAFTSGLPTITDGANPAIANAMPNGIYARRCLAGGPTSTTQLIYDIDTVGVGTPGSDLTVLYRLLESKRPQDMMFAYSD